MRKRDVAYHRGMQRYSFRHFYFVLFICKGNQQIVRKAQISGNPYQKKCRYHNSLFIQIFIVKTQDLEKKIQFLHKIFYLGWLSSSFHRLLAIECFSWVYFSLKIFVWSRPCKYQNFHSEIGSKNNFACNSNSLLWKSEWSSVYFIVIFCYASVIYYHHIIVQ